MLMSRIILLLLFEKNFHCLLYNLIALVLFMHHKMMNLSQRDLSLLLLIDVLNSHASVFVVTLLTVDVSDTILMFSAFSFFLPQTNMYHVVHHAFPQIFC